MATLNLSLTVPDAQAAAILNDLCGYHNYQEFLEDGITPNPQTKAQFAKAIVANFVRESVKAYRASAASEAARLAKIAEVNAISIT